MPGPQTASASPTAVDAVLGRAMAKDPAARPPLPAGLPDRVAPAVK